MQNTVELKINGLAQPCQSRDLNTQPAELYLTLQLACTDLTAFNADSTPLKGCTESMGAE